MSRHVRLRRVRRLLFVLGDRLDADHPGLGDLDPRRDAVLMAEVRLEAERPASHRQRTTLFRSAMRLDALELIDRDLRVRYVRLDDRADTRSLDAWGVGSISR